MDGSWVGATLDEAERAVSTGSPIGPSGFWKAVDAVKRDPDLIEQFADRIARIDRAAFKTWALIAVPIWPGTVLIIGATLIGLVLVGWSYYLEGTGSAVAFLLGFGIILVTTHGLTHLVVGTLMGMRFTHWFVGKLTQPQPGVKLDYATYLRAPATSRAWMHASGAIVTKLMPFVFLGAAIAAGVPTWVVWALVVIGLVEIGADIVWSTKKSDWKKFKREMEFVFSSRRGEYRRSRGGGISSVRVLICHGRDRAVGLMHFLVGADQFSEVGRVFDVDRDQVSRDRAFRPIE